MTPSIPNPTKSADLHRYFVTDDGKVRLEIDFSIDGFNTLRTLASRSETDMGTVLSKALALYKASADAHVAGLSVGTAHGAESLVTEFTGF